jgi:hypothetical protein
MSKRTLLSRAAGRPVRVRAGVAVGAALIVTLAGAAAPAAGAQARAGTVTDFKFGLNAVSALSSSDAWAVGDGATVLHWDGTSWAPVTIPGLPASVALNAVDALSSSDVWAAGEAGPGTAYAPNKTLLVHWDGTAWARVPSPGPSALDLTLDSLSMDSATDGWASGSVYHPHGNTVTGLALHWNGTTWQQVTIKAGFSFSGVASFSPTDAMAVGSHQTGMFAFTPVAFHWNGTSWASAALPSPHGVPASQLAGPDGLSAASAADMWAPGGQFTSTGTVKNLAWHWNGTRWTVTSIPLVTPSGSGLTGVAAASAANVWATGYTNTAGAFGNDQAPVSMHRNGTGWARVTTPDPIGPNHGSTVLNAVSNAGPGTVWAVGSYARNVPGGLGNAHTLILRWTGTRWIQS